MAGLAGLKLLVGILDKALFDHLNFKLDFSIIISAQVRPQERLLVSAAGGREDKVFGEE